MRDFRWLLLLLGVGCAAPDSATTSQPALTEAPATATEREKQEPDDAEAHHVDAQAQRDDPQAQRETRPVRVDVKQLRETQCARPDETLYYGCTTQRGETWYYFCDRTTVVERVDGRFGLSRPLSEEAYKRETAEARERLEVAEYNHRVLGTESSARAAAKASVQFEDRVAAHARKTFPDKESYYQWARESPSEVTAADCDP